MLNKLTDKERKERPIVTGLLDYFPDACAYVAYVSWKANEQHNPGEPMHWAKEKSIGYGDHIGRHLADRYGTDTDGLLHAGKMAWRSLEFLQRLLVDGWPERQSLVQMQKLNEFFASKEPWKAHEPVTINEEAHGDEAWDPDKEPFNQYIYRMRKD